MFCLRLQEILLANIVEITAQESLYSILSYLFVGLIRIYFKTQTLFFSLPLGPMT